MNPIHAALAATVAASRRKRRDELKRRLADARERLRILERATSAERRPGPIGACRAEVDSLEGELRDLR